VHLSARLGRAGKRHGRVHRDERRRVEGAMGWIDPQQRPMLVQLPSTSYERLRASWRLP